MGMWPLSRARRFAADRSGVAAVEFAIIMPFAVLLYIGIIDVTRGVIASRKLNLLSRTISDLVSQQPTSIPTSISKLSTIFASATAVMQPYSTTGLNLTVSAVDIKAKSGTNPPVCCDVTVRWSFTQAGSTAYLRTCGSTLTQVADGTRPSLTNFPQSLVTANSTQGFAYTTGSTSYVIITDASYTYVPIFHQAIAWFSSGMTKTTFMVPRAPSNPIVIANPNTATAPQMGCTT